MISCVLIKWGVVMWNGHKVLVQGGCLVNLMCSYCVILSYVPWFKCVCEHGCYVSTWAIYDILVYVDVVDWYVNDICWPGHQCDMYMTENHMICAWLNVICYTLWILRECHVFVRSELCDPVTEWMISSWLLELCIGTYILSCIQYTHGIHTCVMKWCIHSQE